MANNAATEFLKKVLLDEALRARVAKDPAQAAAVAAELGYEITAEELAAAENALHVPAEAEVVELDEADMDRAAGGGCWNGEDAPDGHEMGCHIFYHDNDYSQTTGNFCKQVYYEKGCRSFGCVETSDL